jgi:hypothetical protein
MLQTQVYHGGRPFVSFTTTNGGRFYCQRELLPAVLRDKLAGNQESD